MKTCIKCQIEKPLESFYKDRTRLRRECKSCSSMKGKTYRDAHADEVLAKDRARRASPAAKECARARTAKWRTDDPDRLKASRGAYYAKNRVADNAKTRAYHLKHRARLLAEQKNPEVREKVRAQCRARYANNPASAARIPKNNARAKIPSVRAATNARAIERYWGAHQKHLDAAAENRRRHPGTLKAFHIRRRALKASAPGSCSAAQLKSRFEFYGNRCAYCGGPAETADHVVALKRGGSNWPANIRPACKSCNSSKHAKKLSVWKAERSAA